MSIIEKALEKIQDVPLDARSDADAESEKVIQRAGGSSTPADEDEAPVNLELAEEPLATTAIVNGPASSRLVSALRDVRTRPVDEGAVSEPSGPTVDLDFAKLRALGIITPDQPDTPLVEQHRLLKRPLLMKARLSGKKEGVERGNLIGITSALPGEGKTFISVNLAMSIAMEVDRTVLLVDADPAKSDVSRVFGVEQRPGLMDYLAGTNSRLSELLIRTNIPKLSLFPSGQPAPNATELMASDQMVRLTEELSQRYPERIVIFDSPPLLATSGAGVLVGLMGQVVMVVEAVRTPQTAVEEALEVMGPRANVGLVLNKQRGGAGNRYGYGYGYQYGESNN